MTTHECTWRQLAASLAAACAVTLACAVPCVADGEADGPIQIVISVENIQPSGLTPACMIRAGFGSSQGAIATFQLVLDELDVSACAQIFPEGIIYEHPVELAAGAHSVVVMVTDEKGAGASAAHEFQVAPYEGRTKLALQVGFSGNVNTTMRAEGGSEEIRDSTQTPSSDVDAGLGIAADIRLAGYTSPHVGMDIGANLIASSRAFAFGDLHAGLRTGTVQTNLGRATIDYSEFTVSGLSARDAVMVGPAAGIAMNVPAADRDWEIFAMRTDSGVSGGLGSEDRFDRYAYGGRHSFAAGPVNATLSATRVWDSGRADPDPGTYAPRQASTTFGLVASSSLAKEPGKADLVGELAWSDYVLDRDMAGTSDSGLAYNFQLAGADGSRLAWSARAYDVPNSYYTLGNPFLTTGHQGVEAGLNTVLENGLNAGLTYADRKEDFLVGGMADITAVPATNVKDWTLSCVWGDGVKVPSLSVSGVWGDRTNDGTGDDRIDQSERTLTAGVAKAWKTTSASLSLSDYSLSDAVTGTACVDTKQISISGRQVIGDYGLGLTWSRSRNELGTPMVVRSRLLDFAVNGPLFNDRLRFEAGYALARNYDDLASYDAEHEQLRLRVGFKPKQTRSLWQRLLASIALEARILYYDDPLEASGRSRRSEIWLVSSASF